MDNGFIKGALISGVLAGVAVMLLAPKAGNQLIEDIVDVFNDAQPDGNEFFDAVKEKGSIFSIKPQIIIKTINIYKPTIQKFK